MERSTNKHRKATEATGGAAGASDDSNVASSQHLWYCVPSLAPLSLAWIPSAVRIPSSGRLVVFAEGRTTKGDGCFTAGPNPGGLYHRAIYYRKSDDNGRTWSNITRLVGDQTATDRVADPQAVYDAATASILVQYRVRDGEATMQIRSADPNGDAWHAPASLDAFLGDAFRGFSCPGVGVSLAQGSKHAGRLVFSVYGTAHQADDNLLGTGFTSFIFSDDHGKTYSLGAVPGGFLNASFTGTDETQVVEMPDGRLLASMRVDSTSTRRAAISSDGGKSWTEDPQALPAGALLPGPSGGCQGTLMRANGSIFYSQPLSPDKSRKRMTVLRSDDDANSWKRGTVVYAGSAAYSCLVPVIGVGSFGVIASALVRGTRGRLVAIKKVELEPNAATTTSEHKEARQDQSQLVWDLRMMLRELKILRALDHDNTVRLVDTFLDERSSGAASRAQVATAAPAAPAAPAPSTWDLYLVTEIMQTDLASMIEQERDACRARQRREGRQKLGKNEEDRPGGSSSPRDAAPGHTSSDAPAAGGRRRASRANRVALSWDVIRLVGLQVFRALAYLHGEACVAHRDVNPRNVLLNSNGHVKLCDMGLACGAFTSVRWGLGRSTSSTSSGGGGGGGGGDPPLGASPYCAPEVVLQHRRVGPPADIWSAACVLLEMCTLAPPFTPAVAGGTGGLGGLGGLGGQNRMVRSLLEHWSLALGTPDDATLRRAKNKAAVDLLPPAGDDASSAGAAAVGFSGGIGRPGGGAFMGGGGGGGGGAASGRAGGGGGGGRLRFRSPPSTPMEARFPCVDPEASAYSAAIVGDGNDLGVRAVEAAVGFTVFNLVRLLRQQQ
eukprot:g933.t1